MSEGWQVLPLSSIAEIRFSNVDKKTIKGEIPVRLCNYMDVYANGGYITQNLPFMDATATDAEIARFGVSKGDVLLTKDSETPDDIGISAVVLDEIPDLICGYHLALLKPNLNKINPGYLNKQLSTRQTAAYFAARANGSTRYGLSSGVIGATPISIAPINQQRHIASILSTLDSTIEHTEALIAKYQQIKAGLMHDLFTRGVLPNGKLRPTREEAPGMYRETEIGWVPREWEVKSLRDCLVSNPTNGIYKPADQIGRGTLLIGQTAFTKERAVDYSLARRAVVTREELQRYSLEEEDLLVARVFATSEGVGQPAFVSELPEPAVYESNMMRLRIIKNMIDPLLLFHWMRSHTVRRYIITMANASNQTSVNQQSLNFLPVPFLPKDEQLKIIAVIKRETASYNFEKAMLLKLRQQKSGLMSDLLTGRVPVKVPATASSGATEK